MTQKRFEDAETLFRESLATNIQYYGKGNDPVAIAPTLTGLGRALIAQHRYDEAETHLLRAHELLSREYTSEHPKLIKNWYALGLLHQARSDFAKAEEAYRQALDLSRRRTGSVHLVMADTLDSLGAMYVHDLARPEEGLPLLEESLNLRRTLLTMEYPALGHGARSVGKALQVLGRLAEATDLFREAVAVYRQTHKGTREDLAQCLELLGDSLEQQGEKNAAQQSFAEATEIRASLHDQDDPRTATLRSHVKPAKE